MPDPNQTDPNNPSVVTPTAGPTVDPTVTSSLPQQPAVTEPSPFLPQEDVPSVPDFQAVVNEVPTVVAPAVPNPTVNNSTVQQPTDSGSAAPIDTPTDSFIPTISTPKKKFGGGKIIATILGLFLLVGGVGAGIVLTQQQAVFQPKADVNSNCVGQNDGKYKCNTKTEHCDNGVCKSNATTPPGSGNCTTNPDKCNSTEQCYNGVCIPKCQNNGDCPGGNICVNNKCVGGPTPTAPPNNGGTCSLSGQQCVYDNNVGSSFCGGSNGKKSCFHTKAETGYLINGWISDANPGCSCGSGLHYGTGGWCLTNTSCNWGDKCSTADDNSCNTTNNSTPTPTPTVPPIIAQCVNIKAYSATWVLLTDAQLKTLTVGTHVNFCATGTTTAETFDRARFTIGINGQPGVLQSETTTHRPTTQDYCQNYVIPASATSFDIKAQLHHVTLGWL